MAIKRSKSKAPTAKAPKAKAPKAKAAAAKAPKAKAPKAKAAKAKAPTAATRASGGGPVPPYGDPIREAIAKGDLASMNRLLADSKKWLAQSEAHAKDVRGALTELEAAIRALQK